MQTIYIPHLLQHPQRTQILHLDQTLPLLDTLTPIRGELKIRHGGTFLEVGIQAETIVTLTCDRCTQTYNDRLVLNTSELIWLEERQNELDHPQEREVSWEDLSESLPPDGHFDVENWIYQQFSLALPLRQLCGKNCQPPVVTAQEATPLDQRWSALEILKGQLSP